MKISQPHISENKGRTTVAADVSTDRTDLDCPKRLYFSTRSTGPDSFSTRADAFVTGLLPLAMILGESLEIDAPVSTRLAHGLEHYQDILTTWWPDFYHRIDIRYSNLVERPNESHPKGVGCCFSGGVDSFQSVTELRMPMVRFPEFEITHALMINGFDQVMDLDHRGVSQQMYDAYSPALAQWGIELVMIDTNLKLFKESVMTKKHLWASFGGALTACAHALSSLFGRFNLPGHATYAYPDLKPVGSHPMLDHHLGTDQLQVIHAGTSMSRTRKLEALANHSIVRDSLRVCFRHPEFDAETGAVINCGKCEKCIRTIISLDLLGCLDEFSTFPNRPPLRMLQDSQVLARIPTIFLQDSMELAQRQRRVVWVDVLKRAAAIRKAQFGIA